MRWMIITWMSAVVFMGCSTRDTPKPGTKPAAGANAKGAKRNLPLAANLQLTGKVLSVNTELRFVVLEFPVGELPALDQRLNVYRQGQKVGELKTSGPQEDTNIVADITAGEARVGDEVRRE